MSHVKPALLSHDLWQVIGDTEKNIHYRKITGEKTFSFCLRACKNLFLLTAKDSNGFGRAHNLMEVRFPRREYAVGQAPQGHSYDRICHYENDLGQSLIGKLRCVRYPIYITSVLQRSVMTMSCSHTEKGTQLRQDTVCGGPHSGLLPHNTSHRHVVWSIALLTPTSVP